MIRVDVNDSTVVTSQRGAYTFYEQDAWAHFFGRDGKPDPHPSKVTIQLRDGQPAYEPGEYVLHPQSLYRGRFGNIELGRIVLVSKDKAASLKVAA